VKKKKIVSLFNLYVALDPIATTFMQSSPYFEGNLIGKDARAIAYRGDPIFNFPHSLYSKYPEFGTLNDYEDDFEKMTKKIMERTNKWKKLLKDNNLTYSEFMKDETSILDSSWKPVKISPHATIENRSSDMNSLDKIFAMSNAMKYISRHVENNTITVVPSKTGDSEPFKLEDKTLYVPQMETLLELQKNSLIFGFEDRNVLHYCNSFLNLVSSIPDIKKQYLQVFYRMINDEKTTSDEIIDFVKKKQGKDDFKTVKDSTAQELALELKEKLYKDLLLTKKLADMTEHATVDTIT
jgi:hypothetical protein